MPGIGIPPIMFPPVVQRNYGKWVSHEVVKPGVLKHVSSTGEECYTVRIGMPSNGRISTATMYKLCDLADKYSEGYFRATQRNALEFVGVPKNKIDALINDLKAIGYPAGGVDNTLHNIVTCAGWFHCQLGATDPLSISKKISDMLYETFTNEDLPAKLKISITACPNNCGEGSTADIGIVGIHRDIPRVNAELVGKTCEIPLVISICPTAAIKPKEGSVIVDPARCMHCGACYMACAAMPIGDEKTDGVAIFVGGKCSAAGAGPSWGKLVVPYLPNNPPHWPDVTAVVKKIMEAWKKDARQHERIIDWISRIGWEGFFKKTGLQITMKSVDGFTFGTERSIREVARFRW